MVRVADDQLAIRRRADQQVDAVFVQVRLLTQNLRLYRRRFRQIGEGAVVHATQAREQRVLQIKIDQRPGAEHLQATDLRVKRGNRLGQQCLIIVAGTDDDLLGSERPGRALQASGLDIAHQRGKVKLNTEVATQIVDQRRNRFARVQLLVVHPV